MKNAATNMLKIVRKRFDLTGTSVTCVTLLHWHSVQGKDLFVSLGFLLFPHHLHVTNPIIDLRMCATEPL